MNTLIKLFFLIVILLQLAVLPSCLGLTRSSDIFITEQGEGSFTEIVLFNGDTLCVSEHLKDHENAPKRKGKIIHFHITDDSIRDFFAAEGTEIIHPHVHENVKDDSFMLIDQKPMDSVFGKYVRLYYNDTDYLFKRKYDTISNYNGTMSMMENSNIHSYWILVIKTADVYGPLTFDQYLTKKDELEVPEDLKLKCERK